MVILLLGIISAISIVSIGGNIDQSRFDATVAQMAAIRKALIGDQDIMENNVRTSFGFNGDVGRVPTTTEGLSAIITNPGLATWAISAAARISGGWNGPYLSGGLARSDYTKDAWGHNIVYDTVPTPHTLTSLGADNAANGSGFNQDIVVTLPAELTSSTVYGFISDHTGTAWNLVADIEINYPDGTGVTTTPLISIAPAANGYFSIASVPPGIRSVTIYWPDKATHTKTLGPIIITVDVLKYLIPGDKLWMP